MVLLADSEGLDQSDWDSEMKQTLSIDQSCEKFTSAFLQFCRTCIPHNKVLIRPNAKPWFTSKLRHNIRLKNRLQTKALHTKVDRDIKQLKMKRNRVNNMKRYAKKKYDYNLEELLSNTERGNKTF